MRLRITLTLGTLFLFLLAVPASTRDWSGRERSRPDPRHHPAARQLPPSINVGSFGGERIQASDAAQQRRTRRDRAIERVTGVVTEPPGAIEAAVSEDSTSLLEQPIAKTVYNPTAEQLLDTDAILSGGIAAMAEDLVFACDPGYRATAAGPSLIGDIFVAPPDRPEVFEAEDDVTTAPSGDY